MTLSREMLEKNTGLGHRGEGLGTMEAGVGRVWDGPRPVSLTSLSPSFPFTSLPAPPFWELDGTGRKSSGCRSKMMVSNHRPNSGPGAETTLRMRMRERFHTLSTPWAFLNRSGLPFLYLRMEITHIPSVCGTVSYQMSGHIPSTDTGALWDPNKN